MDVKSKLSEIVGAENFSDDPVRLQAYATDFSYTPAGAPNYVARPAGSEEVARVIRFCNENHIPVVPVSSKVHFFGATIPKEGGLVLDLSRMNQILEIDPDNRRVRFETGVTWDQLTKALSQEGYPGDHALDAPGRTLGAHRLYGARRAHQSGLRLRRTPGGHGGGLAHRARSSAWVRPASTAIPIPLPRGEIPRGRAWIFTGFSNAPRGPWAWSPGRI